MNQPSIGDLFAQYGTDKVRNEYVELYEAVLAPIRRRTARICEIGIGTLMPDAASSMALFCDPGYRPGGSLRAFRDYCSKATILGLDVQPDTQFCEDRIRTGLCDSTDALSVARFFAYRDRDFDLVIDDGLHTAAAQLATLVNFQDKVVLGGVYVIEDMFPASPMFTEWRTITGNRFELISERVNAIALRRVPGFQ